MVFMGLVLTILGWVVAVGSVGLASGNGARLVIVLIGIALSLTGILGVINPAYMKNAIWKK